VILGLKFPKMIMVIGQEEGGFAMNINLLRTRCTSRFGLVRNI